MFKPLCHLTRGLQQKSWTGLLLAKYCESLNFISPTLHILPPILVQVPDRLSDFKLCWQTGRCKFGGEFIRWQYWTGRPCQWLSTDENGPSGWLCHSRSSRNPQTWTLKDGWVQGRLAPCSLCESLFRAAMRAESTRFKWTPVWLRCGGMGSPLWELPCYLITQFILWMTPLTKNFCTDPGRVGAHL